jgi:hypothetical protein
MSEKCQRTKSLRDSPLKRGLAEGAITYERSSVAGRSACLEDRGVVNLIQDRSCPGLCGGAFLMTNLQFLHS